MRWYLGILGGIIFLAGSAMSWGHTATFFAENGFDKGLKGLDPLYGVLLVECLFLMGAGAEIYMRKTGQKSTWSIKLALGVGALTVFWANFRYGLAYGWEGMAAGTIIIIAILIAETVLADIVLAVQKERASQKAADQPPSGQPTSQPVADISASSQRATTQPVAEVADTPPDQPLTDDDSTTQPVDQPSASAANHQPAANHSAKATSQPNDSTSHSVAVAANQPNKIASRQPSTTQSTSQGSANDQPAKATKQPVASQGIDQPTSRVHSQPTTTKQPTKKKSATRSQSTIQPAAKVVEVAEKYRKENGDWPSQRKLAELAGVTRHQATKVLNQLTNQPADKSATDQPTAKQANG